MFSEQKINSYYIVNNCNIQKRQNLLQYGRLQVNKTGLSGTASRKYTSEFFNLPALTFTRYQGACVCAFLFAFFQETT